MNDFLPPTSLPVSKPADPGETDQIENRKWVYKPEGPLKANLVAVYITSAALSLYCAVSILVKFGTILSFQEASDAYATTRYYSRTQDFVEDYNNFVSISELLFIFSLPFVVAVIAWTYNSHVLVQPMSPQKRKWGVGWAIGGWFTPIGFFFIPLLVNRETEEIICPNKKQKSQAGPAWFYSIWGAIALRRIADQMILGDSDLTQTLLVYMLGDALTIAAAGLAVLYFGEISLSVSERGSEISSAKAMSANSFSDTSQVKSDASISTAISVESDGSVVGDQIRMLGKLHAEGLISDAEFSEKKGELLKRL